jgi:hypothetical protein
LSKVAAAPELQRQWVIVRDRSGQGEKENNEFIHGNGNIRISIPEYFETHTPACTLSQKLCDLYFHFLNKSSIKAEPMELGGRLQSAVFHISIRSMF